MGRDKGWGDELIMRGQRLYNGAWIMITIRPAIPGKFWNR